MGHLPRDSYREAVTTRLFVCRWDCHKFILRKELRQALDFSRNLAIK